VGCDAVHGRGLLFASHEDCVHGGVRGGGNRIHPQRNSEGPAVPPPPRPHSSGRQSRQHFTWQQRRRQARRLRCCRLFVRRRRQAALQKHFCGDPLLVSHNSICFSFTLSVQRNIICSCHLSPAGWLLRFCNLQVAIILSQSFIQLIFLLAVSADYLNIVHSVTANSKHLILPTCLIRPFIENCFIPFFSIRLLCNRMMN